MAKKMSKKALLNLARSWNATDLTYDHSVSKVCECLTEVAYSAGMYGCTASILKDQDGNFYVIKDRTSALWVYGV